MPTRIQDYSALVSQAIEAHLAANLEDGISLYEDRTKAKISIQGPPRSTPGHPPHMDTTALHDSIDHVTDATNLVASCGSEMPYASTLELSMNREYWIPTLTDNADDIAREICKP